MRQAAKVEAAAVEIEEETTMTKARRKFTAGFKAKVAIAAIQGQKTVNEIAGDFGVHPNQVTAWKKQLLENVAFAFGEGTKRSEKSIDAERDQLFRQIGQLQVENDWLKKKTGHLG
jgi:transposase-like protein